MVKDGIQIKQNISKVPPPRRLCLQGCVELVRVVFLLGWELGEWGRCRSVVFEGWGHCWDLECRRPPHHHHPLCWLVEGWNGLKQTCKLLHSISWNAKLFHTSHPCIKVSDQIQVQYSAPHYIIHCYTMFHLYDLSSLLPLAC